MNTAIKMMSAPGGFFLTRRIRIWLFLVLGIVGFLGLQELAPQWLLLPQVYGSMAPSAILVLVLTAMACEYIDSSLGMGYGTSLTPLLLLAGFEPLQIVPCILFSELLTGVSAAVMHHRDGNVNLLQDSKAKMTVLLLSVLSGAGAIAAVMFAIKLPKIWLSGTIGTMILAVGILIVLTGKRRFRFNPTNIIVLGTVAAFNKGFSGGGYGPVVTAGQVVSGIPAKNAVAITSLAESITCFVGLAAYIYFQKEIVWSLAIPLTVGAMLSVPMATLTVKRLPEKMMRTCVGITTCILGGLILIRLF